uniref:Uncharacterized protein n=1 Tax=Arundo donax TaxID=35708 RepID=A0A0A9HRI9_ARUDO
MSEKAMERNNNRSLIPEAGTPIAHSVTTSYFVAEMSNEEMEKIARLMGIKIRNEISGNRVSFEAIKALEQARASLTFEQSKINKIICLRSV